jgi:ADP-heptose:LPS heptosyltransferase
VRFFVFKPDEIGDFVISTGAIRLLARERGEQNIALAVKSEIAPLARREFPQAEIIAIPWQPRRKGHNQTLANLRSCFPVWRRLRRLRVEQSVCLRSARSYLHVVLFAAPRAKQRFAAENVLLLNGSARRRMLETLLSRFGRTQLIPYPELGVAPTTELAAHRAVVAAVLDREIGQDEIMPSLVSAPWRGGSGWLLCPFSSRPSKDYDAGRWATALCEATKSATPAAISLTGSPDQAARLGDFAADLHRAGFTHPVEILPPLPLDAFPDAIAGADLVLTVDTAAAHFACATGAPAVIVHSGQHPGVYAPYSRNGRQKWLVGNRDKLGKQRWRESIPPENVSAAILRVLGA